MQDEKPNLSRISKLFADRDSLPTWDGLRKRRQFGVTLVCGADVAGSYMLQLAVLTAAKIATRCFPDAVRIALPVQDEEAATLLWPEMKERPAFGAMLRQIVGAQNVVVDRGDPHRSNVLMFGDAPESAGALRVTFDGWVAKTGPASQVVRLPERPYCSLAAVLSAALAVSELFLSFAEISLEARRRTVALSLWRPELDPADPDAIGPVVGWLPAELWVLGLGHLGNAYLWALGTLPYATPSEARFFLNDFDSVEDENIETGLLFSGADIDRSKARTCAGWLERRGFRTRLLERRFDKHFRCQHDEPRLALCGFDSNPPRRDLASADFLQVIESGLGGTSNNFDTLCLHALPNPRGVHDLWPDLSDEEEKRQAQQERVAEGNEAYARSGLDECGRFEFAGKSIAVPFVGAVAGCLVVAETLRLFHDGPAYTDIKLRLGGPKPHCVSRDCRYGVEDTPAHKATTALSLQGSSSTRPVAISTGCGETASVVRTVWQLN